jgi:hypothetical protein
MDAEIEVQSLHPPAFYVFLFFTLILYSWIVENLEDFSLRTVWKYLVLAWSFTSLIFLQLVYAAPLPSSPLDAAKNSTEVEGAIWWHPFTPIFPLALY